MNDGEELFGELVAATRLQPIFVPLIHKLGYAIYFNLDAIDTIFETGAGTTSIRLRSLDSVVVRGGPADVFAAIRRAVDDAT